MRVHIVPLLCTEGEKDEDDDDDLTEPTLNDGSLALKHDCTCVCACTHSSIPVHALCRLHHCNGAVMPEKLNGESPWQKKAE